MSRKHIKKIYSSDESNNSICAIIPAAGCGRRMKSYGPKALLDINNKTIITNQITILEKLVPFINISLVCGFKSEKLMKNVPERIIKIENELYETTNVVRSIGVGLRTIQEAGTLLLIYGDLNNSDKKIAFKEYIRTHANIHEDMNRFLMDSHYQLIQWQFYHQWLRHYQAFILMEIVMM